MLPNSPPPFECSFVIPGTPCAYSGHKSMPFRKMNGQLGIRRFNDARTEAYRSQLRAAAETAARWEPWNGKMRRREHPWPSRGECVRHLFRVRPIKRKGDKSPKCACAFCQTIWVVEFTAIMPDRRKRDLDNIMKNIGDALTGILWCDDDQVIPRPAPKGLNPSNPRLKVRVIAHTMQSGLFQNETEAMP